MSLFSFRQKHLPRRGRTLLLTVPMVIGMLTQAPAQSAETLADIRQELSVLFVEIQGLKRELSTTGAPNVPSSSGSILDRVNAIEQELQRVTAQTEDLEFRIERIVSDGTNRLGDLEFRLVELEGGDLSQLGATSTLGGGDAPTTTARQPQQGGAELALSEQSDFERAKEALDSGSFRSAADLFATFTATYPGGPLTAPAHFYRGEALAGLNEKAPAARAYLESFSGAPDGQIAPLALFKLGASLGALGQISEACVTLGEVQVRFPDTDVAFDAGAERRALECP